MARSKSVIMSTSDKKALLIELKPQIAKAKAELKELTLAQKAEIKALSTELKAQEKALVEKIKTNGKELALAEKKLANLIAQNEELKAA